MLRAAFILAGGLGTRLSELTKEKKIPKALAEVNGKAIVEWQIEMLAEQGINNFVLGVGYLSDKIEEYFASKKIDSKLKIFYSKERELLGTAGALKLAAKNFPEFFGERFLMCNGDTLWKFPLDKFYEFHKRMKEKGCAASLLLVEVEDVSEYGSVVLQNNLIVEFVEKGKQGNGLINSGIYIIEPEFIEAIPKGKASIERDVFERLAKENRLAGIKMKIPWYPIDSVAKLEFARKQWLKITNA